MISQEFLDLTVLIMKTEHDVWSGNDATVNALEEFFERKYDRDKVIEAIEYLVQQGNKQLENFHYDY